jgi:sugar lactone lactonase YvrE
VEDLITTGLDSPSGIALDIAAGKMYWTENIADKIRRANLDGTVVEDLVTTGLSIPSGIALDIADGKMYWTDPGTDKIQRADLDGSNVVDLITALPNPFGIALDVAGGKMYWTDYGADKIQRADLDGSAVEDLVTTGLFTPQHIALDVAGGKMYWADLDTQKIQRANLNGTSVEDLVTTENLVGPRGIALDVAGGKMYWSDSFADKIQRANLDGSGIEDLVTGLSDYTGVALQIVPPPPEASFDPAQLDFEQEIVGDTSLETTTLTNTGGETMIVSNIEVVGTDAAVFAFSGSTTPSILPAGTLILSVDFTPAATQVYSDASLSVTHNGPGSPSLVPMIGEGVPAIPVISVDPTELGFGAAVVGTSFELTVTVSNIGNVALEVTDTAVTGTDTDQFSVNAPFTVAPEESHELTVTFSPTSIGAKAANLVLTHNAIGSPTVVPLTGEGLAEPGSFLFIADSGLDAVFRVDPVTGNRTIISDATTGTGPALDFPFRIAVEPDGNLLVSNNGTGALIRIDPLSGDRTVIADAISGSGPGSSFGNGVVVGRAGRIFVVESSIDALIEIDAVSGVRTVISDASTGSGPTFPLPTQLALDEDGDFYIVDTALDAIIRVDSDSGDRTLISDASTGTGDIFQSIKNISVETDGSILAVDFSVVPLVRGVIRVDPTNGNRTVVSNDGTGTGPSFGTPGSVLAEAGGDIILSDKTQGVFRVDPVSGDRTILSDNPTGLGPGFGIAQGVVVKYNAALSLSSETINFEPTQSGESTDQIVTVSNTGSTDLDVTATAITGVDADQFSTKTPFTVSPGQSHDITIDFVPTSLGSKTARLELTHNASVFPSVISLEGQAVGHADLSLGIGFAGPGQLAVLSLYLAATVPVGGVEFEIRPEYIVGENESAQDLGPEVAEFFGAINAVEALGFDVSSSTGQDGVTTILVFSLSGDEIPSGEIRLVDVAYDIDPELSPGSVIDVVLQNDVVGDGEGDIVPSDNSPGSIQTGTPGDVAGGDGIGDGQLDVLDLVKEIKFVLGTLPLPNPADFEEPEDEAEADFQARAAFQFYLADLNDDGAVNVLDVVAVINDILGLEDPPTPKALRSTPIAIGLNAVYQDEEGRPMIPVTIGSDALIGGAEFTFDFDPELMDLGDPVLTGHGTDMTVQSANRDGRMHVLIYSATGARVPAGQGVILLVPVTLIDDSAVPTVTLVNVLLAGPQALPLPVNLENAAVRVLTIPDAYSLGGNAPNPFNPSTSISYDVPEQAHMTLIIYNVLGQEVIRLVDEVQQAGRYTGTWHGRNAKGALVSSGVYVYRLTSSTGYNEAKRMTLLK